MVPCKFVPGLLLDGGFFNSGEHHSDLVCVFNCLLRRSEIICEQIFFPQIVEEVVPDQIPRPTKSVGASRKS